MFPVAVREGSDGGTAPFNASVSVSETVPLSLFSISCFALSTVSAIMFSLPQLVNSSGGKRSRGIRKCLRISSISVSLGFLVKELFYVRGFVQADVVYLVEGEKEDFWVFGSYPEKICRFGNSI